MSRLRKYAVLVAFVLVGCGPDVAPTGFQDGLKVGAASQAVQSAWVCLEVLEARAEDTDGTQVDSLFLVDGRVETHLIDAAGTIHEGLSVVGDYEISREPLERAMRHIARYFHEERSEWVRDVLAWSPDTPVTGLGSPELDRAYREQMEWTQKVVSELSAFTEGQKAEDKRAE